MCRCVDVFHRHILCSYKCVWSCRYTQFPIGELDEGDSYMFRVQCVNKYGASAYSEPSDPILASDGVCTYTLNENNFGFYYDIIKF